MRYRYRSLRECRRVCFVQVVSSAGWAFGLKQTDITLRQTFSLQSSSTWLCERKCNSMSLQSLLSCAAEHEFHRRRAVGKQKREGKCSNYEWKTCQVILCIDKCFEKYHSNKNLLMFMLKDFSVTNLVIVYNAVLQFYTFYCKVLMTCCYLFIWRQ